MTVGVGDVTGLWGYDDIHEHLSVLQELVRGRGYKTVIELGVRAGVSTAAFLEALEDTDGHLWSVDTHREHIWPALFDEPRWTFVQGADLDLGVVSQLPEVADVVFVDTDHRYDLTMAEIDTYRNRVRHGGVMVFHDTALESFPHHQPGTEPPYPVREAVSQKLAGLPWHVFDNCNGLIVVWM